MTKNKIILPKGYLSWSQRDLWRKSPNQYRKRYFEDAPGFSTKYMRYGSKLGKALETRDFFDLSKSEIEAVSQIPRMDTYEYKFETEKENIGMSVNYLGYLDASSKDLSVFHEYKTSKNPWTQNKVNNHGQIKDYALMVYKKTGVIPSCSLFWIETNKDNKGDIVATGKVERFDKDFTVDELKKTEIEIYKTATEISEAYLKWQTSDHGSLSMADIDAYVELKYYIRDLECQANELLSKIEKDLVDNNLESFEHESGSFSFRRTKKYEYPVEFLEMEMSFNKVKKDFSEKKKAIESTLEPLITKSLSFRGKYK